MGGHKEEEEEEASVPHWGGGTGLYQIRRGKEGDTDCSYPPPGGGAFSYSFPPSFWEMGGSNKSRHFSFFFLLLFYSGQIRRCMESGRREKGKKEERYC